MAEAGNSSVATSARGKGRSKRSAKDITKPKRASDGGKRPRVQLRCNVTGPVTDMDLRPFVQMALGLFNAENYQSDEEGPYNYYELVEIRKCIRCCARPIRFHFNFIARPENKSDAENQLFFAEIKTDAITNLFCCSCCCIIGPPGTLTGLNGCGLTCVKYPRHVHHPKDGFTKEPRAMATHVETLNQ